MARTSGSTDPRTPAQIREHYEVERELADRLRQADPAERQVLYSAVYDELFRRVPHHPQVRRRGSPEVSRQRVERQLQLLERYLHADLTFLEVGPGDGALAVAVARRVAKVHAVDVSTEISQHQDWPANASFVLSDGSSVPVPPDSVDLAYSYQLMEHLHPDDAVDQLRNLHRALAAGGLYICCTPNRLNGPHDVSQHFDQVATGFHLKEYTYRELADLFQQVGFSRLRGLVRIKGRYLALPIWLLIVCESLLLPLPFRWRRVIARKLPYRHLLETCLVGTKRR